MLATKWKGSTTAAPTADSDSGPEELKPGQIRSFRIAKLDQEKKRIDLELAS
jgi:hypothetical protein